MNKHMHPMDTLCIKAKDLQVEPIAEYIRDNYYNNELLPIMTWIVDAVNNDDYIFHIYDEIGKLGPAAYNNSISQRLLFREPLALALQSNRPKIAAKICGVILQWSPFIIGNLHAIELACRTRNLHIFETYLHMRGMDFIKDPDIIEVILQEDYVELMDFCLKLKLDKRMRLSDGRNLYEAAVSDEMRALLDERLIPPSLSDR